MRKSNLGIMQGRLTSIKGGKIQSFPWQNWRQEFTDVKQLGLRKIEWTVDLWRFYKNPLIRDPSLVKSIVNLHDIEIISVTSDAHMHGNFWTEKRYKNHKNRLDKLTLKLLAGMKICQIKYLVVPVVDESSLESAEANDNLCRYFIDLVPMLESCGVTVLFEADFAPKKFRTFIEQFPQKSFGINYDIGNSAALGFDPNKEFEEYGDLIRNVHVKDRPFEGQSCVLGTGDADFNKVVQNLRKYDYSGNFVMQTARSKTYKHLSIMRDQLEFWQNQWKH
jgi:L-ribulose-5-phosphate 3-epimerase